MRWVQPQTLPHEPGDPASLSADRVFTVYKARDGALWIGTASGLDRLDPTRDGFTSYGHDPTDERSLSIFTLAFSALSYSAPEKTRYRYRLEGFEREWNAVDSRRRQATYTSLAAGRYTLRVQASTDGEVWSDPGVRLALQVLPPWWATWWSRSVMGALALSLLIIAHRAHVRTLNRKATRPQRIVTLSEIAERKRVEEHLRLLLDITDRRVAKQDPRAGEAAHAKSALAAPTSHEIRTPDTRRRYGRAHDDDRICGHDRGSCRARASATWHSAISSCRPRLMPSLNRSFDSRQ